jgi:SAM-dependent methyltransferase
MHQGDQFFDDDNMFEYYRARRHRADGPNETLEKPVFLELLGDVSGREILDLGCGDGVFGQELLTAGCQSYLGLEASRQMVQLARQNLQETSGQIVHIKIEDWDYPPARFDLVISRLALHYVADLDETFHKVNHTLRRNGRFVFSIVHPVITSCDRSREEGGMRQEWIVDDYFTMGPRKVYFMGEFVEQYHRPIEEIYKSLQDANFQIEQLRESCPRMENFTDVNLYERRKRIPLFLFLSGRKR